MNNTKTRPVHHCPSCKQDLFADNGIGFNSEGVCTVCQQIEKRRQRKQAEHQLADKEVK